MKTLQGWLVCSIVVVAGAILGGGCALPASPEDGAEYGRATAAVSDDDCVVVTERVCVNPCASGMRAALQRIAQSAARNSCAPICTDIVVEDCVDDDHDDDHDDDTDDEGGAGQAE